MHVGDLLLLAAYDCLDFLGKTKDGRVNLPNRELTIERVVPIEKPEARSESRPDAIRTNGVMSILVHTEQVPDPADIIRKQWAKVSRFPNVSKLIKSLLEHGPGPSPLNSVRPPSGMSYLDNYCAVIISDAIVRIERGKELAGWSHAAAERLLRAMSNLKHVSFMVAPLVNFYAEGGLPIAVTDRVTLRPATEDETEDFGVRKSILGSALTSLHGFTRFMPTQWVAEISFMRPPEDGTPDLQAFLELDAAVASLRVLGDQFFDYPIAAIVDQPYNHASRGQPPIRTPTFQKWSPFEGPFVLLASDIPDATKFVRRVLPVCLGVPPKEIKIAVNRLRDASTRELDSDLVIDGVIAMEAVLLRGGEKQRSFRLAARAAILVGNRPEERKRVYDFVSLLNVGRGDLLHGREDNTKGINGRDVLSLARSVVRGIVKEVGTQPIGTLVASLDRQVHEISRNTADPLGRILAVELKKRHI
jgi:hypothetical protein